VGIRLPALSVSGARGIAFACTLGFVAVPGTARADASSWLFAGGGGSTMDPSGSSGHFAAFMQLDAGLGTSPSRPFVIGGLARTSTRFGDGTDLGLFVRLATRGYVRGDWGGAIDLGGYERWWGPSPAPGYAGTVSLGAPWGITLNLNAARDTNETNTFSAVLGLDFARFTVYRRTGLNWFSNPFPSPRQERVE
jgi:hypothetical protein